MTNRTRTAVKSKKRTPAPQYQKGKESSPGRRKTSPSYSRRRRSDALGNPRELYERYMALARAAASGGNVIKAENYYQHAEHYIRLTTKKAT